MGKKIRKNTTKTKRNSRKQRTRKNQKRQIHNRSYGGNGRDFIICETEGGAFYPSLEPRDYGMVTKVYRKKDVFDREYNTYQKLHDIDPEYNVHVRTPENGQLTDTMINDINERYNEEEGRKDNDPTYKINKCSTIFKPTTSSYYLNIEYAGIALKDMDRLSLVDFGLLVDFIRNILSLKNPSGDYYLHIDLNTGNICYDESKNKLVLIDVTNSVFIKGETPVNSFPLISLQFLPSLKGLFNNYYREIRYVQCQYIMNELSRLMESEEISQMTYEKLQIELLSILDKSRESEGQVVPKSPEVIQTKTKAPRKKPRTESESPIGRNLFGFAPSPPSPLGLFPPRPPVPSPPSSPLRRISFFDDF